MSFDAEFAPEGHDSVTNEVVDVMTTLPVEPEVYEQEAVLVVNGVPLDGSGAFWDDDDACEEDEFVPFDRLIPVEEPDRRAWPSADDDDELARTHTRELVNDAYARAAAAWSDDEADDILQSSLPEGAGLMGGWM